MKDTSLPGVSHPCLDQGCLWPVVNGAHQKKEDTSQGWPVSALGASGGAGPVAARESREEEGGSAASRSCHRLPTFPLLTLTSPFLPLFPLGYPQEAQRNLPYSLSRSPLPLFLPFFFFCLKYCKFIFSPQHFSLHCSST